MPQSNAESSRTRLRSTLDAEAQRGCCTIIFDGGEESRPNVSERACQRAAEEVRGSWTWREGPC